MFRLELHIIVVVTIFCSGFVAGVNAEAMRPNSTFQGEVWIILVCTLVASAFCAFPGGGKSD